MAELLECDIVMKGGITSGVVYPSAVVGLAERYRLRSVGGASAGAIAAAAAAAAEHNRDGGGFEALAALPAELATDLAGLFQPADDLAPLFDLAFDAKSSGSVPWRRVVALVAGRWLWPVVVALVAVFAGAVALFWVDLWAGLFGLAVFGLAVVAAGVLAGRGAILLARRVLVLLDANNFGFCDGNTPTTGRPATPKPLTQWLDDLFSRLAGLPADEPLTFGHLWGPQAVAAYRDALERGEHLPPTREVVAARRIDLRMMGTNVSMARPHTLPFDARNYLWCDDCLARYFSAPVRQAMRDCPSGGHPEGGLRCPVHGSELWRVPAAPDLPVVVAVRISLSFPVLFSAVPLHTIDRYRQSGKQDVRICWFADGGISSNFPIHLFDEMWPTRPTFGISLGPQHPDFPAMVYRPTTPAAGIHLRIAPIDTLAAFLHGILDTMQNWADALQRTQPGYRDRVVEIRTADSEGGMNIAMTAAQIRNLAARGAEAAAELAGFDFDEHQWVRYRSAMSQMANVFESMHAAWTDPRVPVERLLDDAWQPGAYRPASAAWRSADASATRSLLDTIQRWEELGHPARRSNPPRPSPEIRITPRA